MAYRGTLNPQSRRSTYEETLEVTEDGEPFADIDTGDVTAASVSFCKPGRDAVVLQATLADGGVTIPSTGVIAWRFEASQLAALEPGPWRLIVEVTASGTEIELVDSILPLT